MIRCWGPPETNRFLLNPYSYTLVVFCFRSYCNIPSLEKIKIQIYDINTVTSAHRQPPLKVSWQRFAVTTAKFGAGSKSYEETET